MGSGMNRAGGVMQVRENLARFFSCAAKKGCAIKKGGKTFSHYRSFISQAEQFARTRRSKNNNRISMNLPCGKAVTVEWAVRPPCRAQPDLH